MTADAADQSQTRRAWWILAAVGLSNLQMSMGLSMIFVVFPDLQKSFPHSSSATLSWAVNIFTIVGASTLVLGSAISVRRGAKQALLSGSALFTLASVAAALAPNVNVLIGCRVAQALGASLTMPSSAAIVFREFPIERRRAAMATWTAVGAVGATLGPSLGGLLIDVGSWRWAFWLNLPMGAVAIATGVVVLPRTAGATSVPLPDALGGLALFAGLGAVVLGLVQTHAWGWDDPRTVVAIIGGLALLLVVVRRSARHARPLLRLDLFRDRSFGFGNVAMLLFSVSFFGFVLTSVLFLTDVWGYSIRRAGLFTTPVFAVTALMAVFAGHVGPRRGFGSVLLVGGLLWAAGTLWMAVGAGGVPQPRLWLAAVVVIGLGSGLLWSALYAITLSALPLEAMSTGAGMNQTLQNLGNTLGVAIVVTVLGTVTLRHVGAFPGVWTASAITTVVAAGAGGWALARPIEVPAERDRLESLATG